MISAQQLYKSFGEVKAVQNVSFKAQDGQITGLLGPNGAGKTTTIRMLCSLLPPDQGEILIDGVNPVSQPLQAKRAIGVVPDARGLYNRLTARENIRYFAELHGLSRRDINQRTDQLSETLGMESFIERKCEGFSQGQRVKVAIARALIHNPKTVLLDEPSNGLDVMSTRALREFIRHMKAEGRCVVLSTHIMQEVAALCDHIVIIANGEVSAAGTAEQIRATAGEDDLEDAFVEIIGSGEGLAA